MNYRKKKYSYDRSCVFCGKPGRVRAINLWTHTNVFMCEEHWEPYKDKQGEKFTIEVVDD